jgi:hypothetical protein
MTVNLSQSVIEAIFEIQKYPIMLGAIEDIENFLIDNIDTEIGDEQKVLTVSSQMVSHLKFLRTLRNLLTKIHE